MNLTRVSAVVWSWKRILAPTRFGAPISSASRSATARAAMRRGWVQPIMPAVPRPASRHILGSWVVLPLPVSPMTMSTA